MGSLSYTAPSGSWLDALPLGNGALGAMVDATHANTTLHLNDETGWSGSSASEHSGGRTDAATAAAALAAAREHLAADRAADAEAELATLSADYGQAFLPFGDVRIGLPAGHRLTRRWLDLADATHHIRGAGIDQTSFISHPDRVLVHSIVADAGVIDPVFTVTVTTPLTELHRAVTADTLTLQLRLPADVAPGHRPDRPAITWEQDDIEPVQGAIALSVRHDGHAAPTEAGGITITGAHELLITVATATTFTAPGRAAAGSAEDAAANATARVHSAARIPLPELHARHRRDYTALFDRVRLHLPATPASDRSAGEHGAGKHGAGEHGAGEHGAGDPGVDAADRLAKAAAEPCRTALADPGLVSLLFDYGRYLLIAGSRPGGLPGTLQGIWNDSMQPPWSSNYTLNINTEMNYWGALPARLGETTLPLLRFVEALAENGAETAERLYGCRGWVAHHNSDAWAFSSPVDGDASWAQWPMAGVWLVRQLDEGRRFGTSTPAEVARIWRLARGAARFCLDFLVELPGGGLTTRPSTSPENQFVLDGQPVSAGTGSGMDRSLVRELLGLLPRLAAESGSAGDPILAEAAAALPRIDGHRVAGDGTLQEWDRVRAEADPEHRHLSHLVGLYPGDGLGPDHAAAAAATLDRRGDDSTGWSLAWKLCLRARLAQPERVDDLLELVLRPARDDAGPHAGGLYPNFFAAHPPFQIDGNLGFVAAVCEMLLQSHTGVIDLLPALPASLPDGEVFGLAARDGVLVDLVWAAGTLERVSLRALAGRFAGPRRLRYRGREQRVTVPTSGITLSRTADGSLAAEPG
jgi:alpha-L-fucosidase 2